MLRLVLRSKRRPQHLWLTARSFTDPPPKDSFKAYQKEFIPIQGSQKSKRASGFDPSDSVSLFSHEKDKTFDPATAWKRAQDSERARAANTNRRVGREELTNDYNQIDYDDEGSPVYSFKNSVGNDDFEEETEDFSDLDTDSPDYEEERAKRVMQKQEEKRVKQEKKEQRRIQQLRKFEAQQEAFESKFLLEGDERMLDPRARKLARPTDAGMFENETPDEQIKPEDFASPKLREVVEKRLTSERRAILELNQSIVEQEINKDDTVGEQFVKGFSVIARRQELRQERLKTEAHFQLIGYITQIEDSQSKRLRDEKRAQIRLDKWKAKIKEKYSEKNAKRRQTRLEARKVKAELVKNDPDWFYYRELKYWIHRKWLTNLQVRSTIQALLKNPSYQHHQKRDALDYLIKHLEGAETKSQDWYQNKWQYYKGLAKEQPQHTSPDYTRDPEFKMPASYDELIQTAEAEMTHEEKLAKFAPPPYKPKTSLFEY